MPTNEEMKATMRAYIERLNAADLEGVLALFAPEATVEDPVGAGVHQGAEALRAFYGMALANNARLRLNGPQVGSSSDVAVMPLVVEVAIPDTPVMQINVIESMRFNDAGQVIEMRAYWGQEDMSMAGA